MSKKIKKFAIMIVFFVIALVVNSKVKAATIISFSPENPKVGDTVKVTISIANVNTATITANVSGAASGTIRLVKGDLTGAVSTFSETGSFTCDQEGKLNVSISSDSSAVLNGNYVDVGGSASINVAAKTVETPPAEPETPPQEETPTKSNNANLGNLGIRPNDFKGFKPGTTSYSVTVPNEVDKVEVYAVAKDSKATISGTGNKNLNVGANALSVVVTAEDGTTKTYTINVTREEKTENNTTTNETTNETINETANETANTTEGETTVDYSNYDLQELEVEGYTLNPKFSPDVYEYKLNITSKDVTELNIKTKGKNDKIKIEVVGNTELKDGENIVTILVTNDVTGDNTTYQIIVDKTEKLDLSETNQAIDANIAKANRIRLMILGIVLLIVIAIIIFIVVRHKMNNEIYDEEDKYDYDDDDYIDEETPKALQKKPLKPIEKEENDDNDSEKVSDSTENIRPRKVTEEDFNIENRKNSNKGKHF